jgi:hypothetical protein
MELGHHGTLSKKFFEVYKTQTQTFQKNMKKFL